MDILYAPGQGAALRVRLPRWLTPHGLKLNEAKTRVAGFRTKLARMASSGHGVGRRS